MNEPAPFLFSQYTAAICQLTRPRRSQHLERQFRQVNGEKDAHVGKAEQEAKGEETTQDVSTLENPAILDQLRHDA